MPLKCKCFLCELISVLANLYEGKNLLNALIQSHEFVSWNIAKLLTMTDLITLVSIATGRVKHFWDFGWQSFGFRMIDEQKSSPLFALLHQKLFILYSEFSLLWPSGFPWEIVTLNSLSLWRILHQVSHEWAGAAFSFLCWFALTLRLALELMPSWRQKLWNIDDCFVAIQFKLLMIHGVQFNIMFKTNFTCA